MTFYVECKCPKMQFRALLHVVQCVPCLLLVKSMYLIHVISYRKRQFFTKKSKNHIGRISSQNYIFGGFYPNKKPRYSFVQKRFSATSTYGFGARQIKLIFNQRGGLHPPLILLVSLNTLSGGLTAR